METRIYDDVKEHRHPETGQPYWHPAIRQHVSRDKTLRQISVCIMSEDGNVTERDIDLNQNFVFDVKRAINNNKDPIKRQCFIEVKGEKIVCLAQAGECRFNYNYYSPGLEDKKSWTTPIIEESCPDRCPYKVLVCDNHEKGCDGSITYYPQYNKFIGQYRCYCRNLEKYLGKEEDRERVGVVGEKRYPKQIKDKKNRFFYRGY